MGEIMSISSRKDSFILCEYIYIAKYLSMKYVDLRKVNDFLGEDVYAYWHQLQCCLKTDIILFWYTV